MRAVVVAVLLLGLSGCFGGPSQAEMEAESAQAILDFAQSVLPAGDLRSIHVSGQVSIESEVNGFPVTVNLNPEILATLGPNGDIHLVGDALKLDFEAYCDPERVIAITQGGNDYGVPDMSIEARNPLGFCTGPGSEQLLLPYFEFELVDPALLTGALDLDAMVPIGFDDVDKAILATYEVAGPAGTTTLTFTIQKDRIQKIVSSNDDGNLVLVMEYGDRAAIAVPEAEQRLGSVVRGSTDTSNGWVWNGRFDAGPVADFRLDVHEPGTSITCGAMPEPVVSFDLDGAPDQRKDGWRMVLLENGDGRLGEQDEIRLLQPNSEVSDFDHVVVFHDTWAGIPATTKCNIPAPPMAWGVLGLLALAFVRRF